MAIFMSISKFCAKESNKVVELLVGVESESGIELVHSEKALRSP